MKSIVAKFLLPVGALAILFVVFDVYLTYTDKERHVRELLDRQAALALEFDLAIRSYVAEEIRPIMEEKTAADEFIPEVMSTSFVARSIFDTVRREFPEHIIKFSSDNPRNPANQAGPDELRMIKYFNDHPEADRWTGRINLDGQEYLAHFSARRMEESCRDCHGRPEDAPASLVEQYGKAAGFHRPVGDVVALDTIAIPMAETQAVATLDLARHSAVMVLGLAVLFGGIFLVFRVVVARRVAAMARHFRAIAAQPESASITPVKVRSDDEIGVLAASFNTLAERLHAAHASLEERVAQRTKELAKGNERLRLEISERRRAEEALDTERKQLLSVFDGMDEVVYVADPDSYELLYMNGPARKQWGDAVGQKCYRALQNMDSPCPFCTNDRIFGENGGRPYIWEFQNRVSHRWLRSIDRAIQWPDGRTVRFAIAIDITEQRQIRETLRESEERYRKLFEEARDGIFLADAETGVLVDCNRAAAELVGRDKSELVGQHQRSLHPPDDVTEEFPASFKAHLEGEEGEVLECRVVTATGAIRDVAIKSNRVQIGGRRLLQGMFRDITDRKQVEEELRESEQRLQAILDSIQAGVVIVDAQSRTIVDANPAALRMIDAAPEQVVGHVCHRHICPAEEGHCPISDLGAEVDNSECMLLTLDGQPVPILKTVTPIMLSGRRHLLESFVDISDRKQAEAALARAHGIAEEEARKLRSMIEGMEEGIVVANTDNIITEVNSWFLEKVGLGRDEIIGRSLWELHPDTEGTARLRATLDAFRSGRSREKYVVNRELLGMQVSLRAQPIFEEDRYQGVILNIINVTDLVETRRAAEAAARAKSEFLANMSHEIRTPMTAILGFTDVLLGHGNLDHGSPESREAAMTIKRNGEHLLGIINDILDLSKIEAGKMTVERIPSSPCRILAEVLSLAQVRADAKGLSFGLEYDGPIPEIIQTDPTRLRQILINLISNAIKFTEVGDVRIVARFVDDDTEPFMQFDVVDTGLGMTADQVAKLFQPFSQADASTTRRFGGTGLGLTISKRLTSMLGGDIAVVKTQPGVGTHMRVTAATGPIDGVRMIEDPASATVVASCAVKDTPSSGQEVLKSCRILLAEDGPDNQRLIAHVLRKAGAEVTVVGNGQLAVDAALAAGEEGNPFDVILMDMQMPVMDGYYATGLLRRKGYRGAIIALTAHAMEGDRQRCLDAGCDDYASKPISRTKLAETIVAHLRRDCASAR